MRSFVATLAVTALSCLPAVAFDGTAANKQWLDALSICRIGEEVDGRRVSEQEQEWNCAEHRRLAKQLEQHGYCFDTSEYEWYPCLPAS